MRQGDLNLSETVQGIVFNTDNGRLQDMRNEGNRLISQGLVKKFKGGGYIAYVSVVPDCIHDTIWMQYFYSSRLVKDVADLGTYGVVAAMYSTIAFATKQIAGASGLFVTYASLGPNVIVDVFRMLFGGLARQGRLAEGISVVSFMGMATYTIVQMIMEFGSASANSLHNVAHLGTFTDMSNVAFIVCRKMLYVVQMLINDGQVIFSGNEPGLSTLGSFFRLGGTTVAVAKFGPEFIKLLYNVTKRFLLVEENVNSSTMQFDARFNECQYWREPVRKLGKAGPFSNPLTSTTE